MNSHSPPEVEHNFALALVEASAAPLLLLDKALKVVAASASFCSSFQVSPSSVDCRTLDELGEGEWNLPQLTELLKATASGFAEVANYEFKLVRNGLPDRCLVVNAKSLHYSGQRDILLVLSIADVTDARIAERLKEDLLREKDVLLKEINHRVGNSLQMIASVLMQSARKVNSEETRSHLHEAHHRVMSVAAIQRHLGDAKRGDVQLHSYLSSLCDSIGASMIQDHDQVSLEVTADDSIAAGSISVSLGLIVTELVINALKHAFPDGRKGRVRVDYRSRGPNWTLSVKDDGIGMSDGFGKAKAGLGTSIVEALAKQLDAEIKVTNSHPGTNVTIAHTSVPVLVAQAAV